MGRHGTTILISALSLAILAPLNTPEPSQRPSAGLTPAEVVSIQVSALRQHNHPTPNAGIWTAYQFASPANRKITGPYGRFLQIIKSPGNRPLLHSRQFRIAAVHQKDLAAQVAVEAIDGLGAVTHWMFELSRQGSGPYQDCWMTDSVSQKPPAVESGSSREPTPH